MPEQRTTERFRRSLGKELLSWDTSDMVDAELKYRRENWKEQWPDRRKCPPDEWILKDAYEEQDLFSMWRDDKMDNLTGILMERNPEGEWSASMNAGGWRLQDGNKDFRATGGDEFLKAILPNCDTTWHIFSYGDDGMAVKISSHDSPTGYWVYCWPKGEAAAEISAVVDGMLDIP